MAQSFTLANSEAPTITSPSTATFTTTVAGSYDITTTGFPAAVLSDGAADAAGRPQLYRQPQRHRVHRRHPGGRGPGHLPGHGHGHQRH